MLELALFLLRDAGPYIAAMVAIAVAMIGKRSKVETKSEAHEIIETVDDSVLGRFEELFDRIGILEKDLREAKEDLAQALIEIRELRRLEEYLQGKLHEREEELREARRRIDELEQIIEQSLP